MKKLLIGCGVIALLLMGALGYVGWKLAPAVMETMRATEALEERFIALNDQYPYDSTTETEFDLERFQTALDVRSDLRIELGKVAALLESFESEDLGLFEKAKAGFSAVTEAFNATSPILSEAAMSPVEFTQHVLTYWAAAKSAHDGFGDQQALAALRSNYALFIEIYSKTREDSPEIPRLDSLLESVSEAQSAGARDYLESIRDLGELGDAELILELVMVQLSNPEAGLIHLQTNSGSVKGSLTINTHGEADDDS